MRGTVKFFNSSKGLGSITPSEGSKGGNVRSGDIQRDGGHKTLVEGRSNAHEPPGPLNPNRTGTGPSRRCGLS